jgi:glycosyltransferase involved in cell wall biosynthesis
MNRIKTALNILSEFKAQQYHYLGEGVEGVVFHDTQKVYKVYLPKNKKTVNPLLWAMLEEKKPLFQKTIHFFEILPVQFQGINILTSPYVKGEALSYLNEEEIRSFLTECWQKKWIFHNIKAENFIRVDDGCLKWIDYEIDHFTDNLFLNMAARAFILLKYFDAPKSELNKLNRSAINQFDLHQLAGFQQFCNQLFAHIIYQESQSALQNCRVIPDTSTYILKSTHQSQLINDIIASGEGIFSVPYHAVENLKSLYFQLLSKGMVLKSLESRNLQGFGNLEGFLTFKLTDNRFEPEFLQLCVGKIKPFPHKVSLIIKACPQDSATLYQQVLHLVRQLSTPDAFYEKIIAVDKREQDFLRQYTEEGSLAKLYDVLNQLLTEGIIDDYVELPVSEIESVNQRWFGIKTHHTHTFNKASPISHLYAFEQAKGDYILQMDSDVMVGRYENNHSYLTDMIAELDKNEKVISVGFNICHAKDSGFKPYYGFSQGGFVPEVRLGLFHKARLLNSRPFPNELLENGLKKSWYRALHQKQKETDTTSIRGGDPSTFYIHPQNYRKTCQDVWFTLLDRVENNQIPECQYEEFDLAGSYYDWAIPKRNEALVIVCIVQNNQYSHFLRMWLSVISQTDTDWGIIIIDDASTNGLDIWIEYLVKPYQKQVTYLKNRFSQGVAANLYKAIHYFMENQESVVLILEGDDALLGKQVFENVMEKYRIFGADITIGKVYKTDEISAYYPYPPNFITPRQPGSHVWQPLRTFKKYLFDSLSIYDLKREIPADSRITEAEHKLLSKLSQKTQWLTRGVEYAYMLPMIEMSSNPLLMKHFNYYKEANSLETQQSEEEWVQEIFNKTPKTQKAVFKGRKTFLPHLNKIEIDITYECNLKCFNCSRSCTQAPTHESMSLFQIQQFLTESVELNKQWELINILGGEPTLHPDFMEIVRVILQDYIISHSPTTILQITSNGYSEQTQQILAALPQSENIMLDAASFKESRQILYFTPFNLAPIDDDRFKNADFSKGCWVIAYCGIGLNKYGYYVCSAAGGIDRIFGFNQGIKKLSQVNESIKAQLNQFCRYCGNFSDYAHNQGDFIPRCEKAALTKPILSHIWQKQYKTYNQGKSPKLDEVYPE